MIFIIKPTVNNISFFIMINILKFVRDITIIIITV